MADITAMKNRIVTEWPKFEMPPSEFERQATAHFVEDGLDNNRFFAVASAIPAIAASAINIVIHTASGILKGVTCLVQFKFAEGSHEMGHGIFKSFQSMYNVALVFATAVIGLIARERMYGAMGHVLKERKIVDLNKQIEGLTAQKTALEIAVASPSTIMLNALEGITTRMGALADPTQSPQYLDLTYKLAYKEAELARALKSTSAASEAETATLKNEISSLQRQVERFRTDINSANTTIHTHEAKNTAATQRINELEASLKSTQEAYQAASDVLDKAVKDQTRSYDEKNDELNRLINTLKDRLDQAALEKQVAVESLEAAQSTREQDFTRLQAQLKTLTDSKAAIEAELKTAQAQLAEHEKNAQAHVEEHGKATTRVNELEASLAQATAGKENAEKALTDTQSLGEQTTKVLQEQLQASKDVEATIKLDLQRTQAQLTEYVKNSKARVEEHEASKKRMGELEASLKQAATDKDQAEEAQKTHAQTISGLQAQAASLTASEKAASEELENAKGQVTDLQAAIQKHEINQKKQNEELQRTTKERNDAGTFVKRLEEKVKRLEEKLAKKENPGNTTEPQTK